MTKNALVPLGITAVITSGLFVWAAARPSPNRLLPANTNREELKQTFTNESVGFRFSHPSRFRVLQANEQFAAISDEAGYVVISIDIEETTQPLEQWRRTLHQENTSITPIELGGSPALQLIRQEFDSGPEHELVVIRNSKLIRIRYRGLMDIELLELRESFQFTSVAD